MKTVIELAREAGLRDCTCNGTLGCLERLVELARADERSRTWTQDHWTEYEHSIAAQEREACAELVYNSPPSDEYESPLAAVYRAIQARGNT